MKSQNRKHVFDGISNVVSADIDPATIRLQEDRLLIRDLEENEVRKVGSIYIPQQAQDIGAGKAGGFRFGVVVATGPGNKYVECGLDWQANVRRRALAQICPNCGEDGNRWWDEVAGEWKSRWDCPLCRGTRRAPVTVPCTCKPGDVVIYDRRREAEFVINGETYYIVYEEQAVVCIVENFR